MHKRTLYNISGIKLIKGISSFNILTFFDLKAALMLSSLSFKGNREFSFFKVNRFANIAGTLTRISV